MNFSSTIEVPKPVHSNRTLSHQKKLEDVKREMREAKEAKSHALSDEQRVRWKPSSFTIFDEHHEVFQDFVDVISIKRCDNQMTPL